MQIFETSFLQVGLQEQDQDVARFLYIKDIKTKEINKNLETYRYTRVPFGIIPSPFFLENTIQHHIAQSNSVIALKIEDYIYIDNLVM